MFYSLVGVWLTGHSQKNMLQLIRYMRTLEGSSPESDEKMSKVRLDEKIPDYRMLTQYVQELFANLKQVARQV